MIPDPEPLLYWPENELPLRVFLLMRTQWHRSGDGPPDGLKYEALPEMWRRGSVKRKHRDATFSGLQVMELEALRIWAEKARERRS